MRNKEYKFFKTPAKTAKENNLILCDSIYKNGKKRLFDFSFLNGSLLSDNEMDVLKNDAMNYISASNKTSYYGVLFDQFTACDGIAHYNVHRVYTDNGCRHLYDIYELAYIMHYRKERKSIYENNYNVSSIECHKIYDEPLHEIIL